MHLLKVWFPITVVSDAIAHLLLLCYRYIIRNRSIKSVAFPLHGSFLDVFGDLYEVLEITGSVCLLARCILWRPVNRVKALMANEIDHACCVCCWQISKVYELLVDSLRKLGRLDDAMSAAVSGFVANDQQSSWMYGAWARLMNRLATGENSPCQKIKWVSEWCTCGVRSKLKTAFW